MAATDTASSETDDFGTCERCEDAHATERVQRRLGDIAVGPPLELCLDCAEECDVR